MKAYTYRTTFYRYNYGTVPPLKQESDVIFTTDVPFDDEQFEEIAEKAMWAQNPHWKNPESPSPGVLSTGWSTVMGGNQFTVVAFENK